MKFKTPSPKVLAFLIIVVVLTTATIVSSKLINNQKLSDEKNKQVSLTIKNDLDQKLDPKDSDNDGLPDWQEEIWKTDKNNPDTDGDGTTDGKEVNENRNPTIAGPNDKILSDQGVASQIIKESLPGKTDPNSLTSVLSKNLLLRLAQLQQSGQYTTETGDQLAKDLKDQALQEVQIPEKYPENIFLTFDSKDKKDLEDYGKKILEIQYNELIKIDTNNQELDQLINAFKKMSYELSIIRVPKDLLSTHAKIANNYYIAAEALINLKLSDKDPVLGILSIPIYKKVSEEQPTLYAQVQKYLESSGIILITKQNE